MNFYRILRVSLALILVFTVRAVFSQEAVEEGGPDARATSKQRPARSIQEVMTPDEFKAAGLDKLSEDELQHLDAWLQGYRQTTERKASEQAERKADEEIKKATAEVKVRQPRVLVERVVSRVDGTLTPLTGHNVIKLEDGTVWKQANKDDRYTPPVADHPMAQVSHSPFGYKMRVEGMPEFYVNPVRSKE